MGIQTKSCPEWVAQVSMMYVIGRKKSTNVMSNIVEITNFDQFWLSLKSISLISLEFHRYGSWDFLTLHVSTLTYEKTTTQECYWCTIQFLHIAIYCELSSQWQYSTYLVLLGQKLTIRSICFSFQKSCHNQRYMPHTI